MLNLEDMPLTWHPCSLDPMAILSSSFSLCGLNYPCFWSSTSSNIFSATASVSGWSNFGFPSTSFSFLTWIHYQPHSSKPSNGSGCLAAIATSLSHSHWSTFLWYPPSPRWTLCMLLLASSLCFGLRARASSVVFCRTNSSYCADVAENCKWR